jgi:hypothetical protein
MTARLFCEGSGRDKQIAQESSGHKDGRTGAGMPCRWKTEALQENADRKQKIMQPYAQKAKMGKSGLEKVKQAFHKNRNDPKKTPWCSRQNTLCFERKHLMFLEQTPWCYDQNTLVFGVTHLGVFLRKPTQFSGLHKNNKNSL